MRAAIIAVGTELLMGNTVNTNAALLSAFLNEHGVRVLYHITVGDNPDRLSEAIDDYRDRVDLIITTGGLGPTQDDLTKETVCATLGLPLEVDPVLEKGLRDFFKQFGRPMTENNLKQAMRPQDSLVIPNPNGTAPGLVIPQEDLLVVLLPGPPRELGPMLDQTLHTYFASRRGEVIESIYLRIAGMGESTVDDRLADLFALENPTVAPYVKEGSIAVRITASGETQDQCLDLMEPVISQIESRLGHAVYAHEDISLEEAVGRDLIKQGVTIATAESCTGGLIASKLTNVSGISAVFDRGIVTYSNQAKMDELGVREATLAAHGAVSEQTAREMAEGLHRVSGADIAISVTGIAGPSGGSAEKPVGLVYIGMYAFGKTQVKRFQFSGSRDRVRRYTVINSLMMVREKLIQSE